MASSTSGSSSRIAGAARSMRGSSRPFRASTSRRREGRALRPRHCAAVLLAAHVVALVVTTPGHAARTIRVPDDAASVQAGIDAAVDGDTVLVAPGVYRERIVLNKTITLASHYLTTRDPTYRARTILDGGGGRGTVVTVPRGVGPATALVGFTIRNARGGVSIEGRLQLLDSVVTRTSDAVSFESGGGVVRGNVIEANGDDGIDLDGASDAVIEDNLIRNNDDDGVEIRLEPHKGAALHIVIRRNIIFGNKEDGIQLIGYPKVSPRVLYIQQNLIMNNRMAGVGMMADGNSDENYSAAPLPEPVFLFNNTFVGNDHALSGGANVTARNNIFVGATRLGLKNVAGRSSVTHTLFFRNRTNFQGSNVDETTSLIGDPRFDGRYNLRAGSPAIDAGVSVGLAFNGAAPDLGAYETDPAATPTPEPTPSTPPAPSPAPVPAPTPEREGLPRHDRRRTPRRAARRNSGGRRRARPRLSSTPTAPRPRSPR